MIREQRTSAFLSGKTFFKNKISYLPLPEGYIDLNPNEQTSRVRVGYLTQISFSLWRVLNSDTILEDMRAGQWDLSRYRVWAWVSQITAQICRDLQKRLMSRKQREVHLKIPTPQEGMCMCLPFLWFPKDGAPCHITKTHPSTVTLRPSLLLGKRFPFTSRLSISSLFFLRIWISRGLPGIQSTE